MYTYEYERIHVDIGWTMLSNSKCEAKEHRETIARRAREGWRYVGMIPAVQLGTGVIEEMDLIFERSMEDKPE